jgi:glutamine synthetase
MVLQQGNLAMSVDKILKTLKEKDYQFVDLRFCDTRGKEQHVSLPVKAADEDLFEDGKMFDGLERHQRIRHGADAGYFHGCAGSIRRAQDHDCSL